MIGSSVKVCSSFWVSFQVAWFRTSMYARYYLTRKDLMLHALANFNDFVQSLLISCSCTHEYPYLLFGKTEVLRCSMALPAVGSSKLQPSGWT